MRSPLESLVNVKAKVLSGGDTRYSNTVEAVKRNSRGSFAAQTKVSRFRRVEGQLVTSAPPSDRIQVVLE